MIQMKESGIRKAFYQCACGEEDAYKFFPDELYPQTINCICGAGRQNTPGMRLVGVEGEE